MPIPSGEDRGLAERFGFVFGGFQVGGDRHRPIGEQQFAPGDDRVAVDDALDAETLEVGEIFDWDQPADVVAGGVGDCLGDGVLGGVFEGTDKAEDLIAIGAFDRSEARMSDWSGCSLRASIALPEGVALSKKSCGRTMSGSASVPVV